MFTENRGNKQCEKIALQITVCSYHCAEGETWDWRNCYGISVLFSSVLYGSVLYASVLCGIVLYASVLYGSVLYGSVFYQLCSVVIKNKLEDINVSLTFCHFSWWPSF